jgi:hypothetical protein
VIGKAVALGEVIGRSDRGPGQKIKEIMNNLKVDHVTDEVSHAFDQVRGEIVRSATDIRKRSGLMRRRQKTAAERRERLRVKGITSIFSGTGLTLFLYFLTHAINFYLPPVVIANNTFPVDPVVRVLWLVGLIPVFSGVGRLLASMAIKDNQQESQPEALPESPNPPEFRADTARNLYEAPASVTERTTNILGHVKRGGRE